MSFHALYFWIWRRIMLPPFVVFLATKMFRFNEGDIADDAASYLLAIKESVRFLKVINV